MPKICKKKKIFERSLITSNLSFEHYNAKDICDIIYVHFLTLQILHSEFHYNPIASKYAMKTLAMSFNEFSSSATDLACMIHILFGEHSDQLRKLLRNAEANDFFFRQIRPNPVSIRILLASYQKGIPSPNLEASSLIHMEKDLRITTTNYISIRVLVTQWTNGIEHNDKKLVVTRLLQALRARCPRSDLLPYLTDLAHRFDLELKNVHNPETGEDHITHHDEIDSAGVTIYSKDSHTWENILSKLGRGIGHAISGIGAVGLGALGGLYVGSHLHSHNGK